MPRHFACIVQASQAGARVGGADSKVAAQRALLGAGTATTDTGIPPFLIKQGGGPSAPPALPQGMVMGDCCPGRGGGL